VGLNWLEIVPVISQAVSIPELCLFFTTRELRNTALLFLLLFLCD
jgi:hypothetical protein